MDPVSCYKCGVVFGVPGPWLQQRKEDQDSFWCPNGHRQHFTESSLDKLRRERDRLKQEVAYMADAVTTQRQAREAAEKSATAYKGHPTRVKKRVAGGACPCCKRHFTDLERHMASKHPDYAERDEPGLKVIDGGAA